MHPLAPAIRRLAAAPIDALIFDMDGTILDTRQYHMAAWRELVAAHGLTEREYRIAESGFGKTNKAIFEEWFAGRDAAPDWHRLSAEKEIDFRRLIHGHVRARPGFNELLAHARRRGIRIALATSGPRENAEFILDQLGVTPFFDAVIWGGMAGKSKPHPEPFLLAAQRLGAAPVRCMVFEDSSHGLWAGRRAGMIVIAIAEQRRDLTWIRKWTPFCYEDFRPVVRLIETAGGNRSGSGPQFA